jgi:hypothetical protein
MGIFNYCLYVCVCVCVWSVCVCMCICMCETECICVKSVWMCTYTNTSFSQINRSTCIAHTCTHSFYTYAPVCIHAVTISPTLHTQMLFACTNLVHTHTHTHRQHTQLHTHTHRQHTQLHTHTQLHAHSCTNIYSWHINTHNHPHVFICFSRIQTHAIFIPPLSYTFTISVNDTLIILLYCIKCSVEPWI